MLNRDAILKARDLKKQKVTVPAWGGEVYVREMTVAEAQAYGERLSVEGAAAKSMAHIAVSTVCDEKGVLLFTPADVDALHDMPLAPLKAVMTAAMQINGLGEKAVEEAAKN